jgi:hypothetical protein
MTDRPILFSGPMIRALLDDRKTQTRRLFKGIEQMPNGTWHIFGGMIGVAEPDVPKHAPDYVRIQVGDRLWVRETWQALSFGDYQPTKSSQSEVRYAATDPCADLDAEARGYPWRPSIFMPRWASRLTLIVTDVRVERLQDVSEEDAKAEGIEQDSDGWRDYLMPHTQCCGNPIDSYRTLWDHINGAGAWDANPWVAAYSFSVIKQNIDQIEKVAA